MDLLSNLHLYMLRAGLISRSTGEDDRRIGSRSLPDRIGGLCAGGGDHHVSCGLYAAKEQCHLSAATHSHKSY